MDALEFEPKEVRKQILVSTTFSHVKNITSLHLINKLQKENFSISTKVSCEMERTQTLVDRICKTICTL
jgi:hypothetical protein